MEPINARERRIQFFKFVMLFLLAVVPIVTIVYLWGRVDHVENRFLREQYSRLRNTEQDSKDHGALVTNLTRTSRSLKEFIGRRSGDFSKFHESGSKMTGELGVEIDALEEKIGLMEPTSADSSLVRIATDLLSTTRAFQTIYSDGYDKTLDLARDLKAAEKDLKTCETDLKECDGKVRNYEKVSSL